MTRKDRRGRIAALLAVTVPAAAALVLAQTAPHHPIPPPPSLKSVPVPQPAALMDYVQDRASAIVLGKALFWEMEAGSDGQACASCHFHAGADNRRKNQLSPGLNNVAGAPLSTTFDPTATGAAGGPNYTMTAADFPTHQLADPFDRNSDVLFDSDDVVSSQGVFRTDFGSIHQHIETCTDVADPVYQVGGIDTRRVEPRNAPTAINAAFNFRNFWDGRANNIFNGVNPFGMRDPNARVWRRLPNGSIVPVRIALENASLASQAVGPPLSPFESSCGGRSFPDLGRKLLTLRPLAKQVVDKDDSVLGPHRFWTGKGLKATYATYIRQAFRPEWWLGGNDQMAKNFSMFWGLSVMLYEQTLVSDDAPYDRFASGNGTLTPQQLAGLQIFVGKGLCILCHGGAEFTSAGTHQIAEKQEGGLVERMLMGDGKAALYDGSFYNIGVRPTAEDVGVGGTDPFGNPLSFTRQELRRRQGIPAVDPFFVNPSTFEFQPGVPIADDTRDAVDGAFKVPTLRNVELTGPYFHNGGYATLEQVVEFYNRGGDRRGPDSGDTTGLGENVTNLDSDIRPLGLTAEDQAALVAFLESLTDERVRWEKAPFDHPQLFVPNGHVGDENAVRDDGTGDAADDLREIPAVGAGGRGPKLLPPLKPFLED